MSLGAQTARADSEPVLAEPGVEQETPSQPKAERSYRLEWHFKRVHWAEGVTAGVLGVAAIASVCHDADNAMPSRGSS